MQRARLAIVSDIHYAGAAERARGRYYLDCVRNPVRRFALHLYRHYYWHRDPFAHNPLLDEFVRRADDADRVVANGDYSCDSAFVGLSDDAAFASAAECLARLREAFGPRLRAILGDHELGKKPLGADVGGLRLASLRRAVDELGLRLFWQEALGRYTLLGVTATLIALPVFEAETLPEELPEWRRLRAEHLDEIRRAFAGVESGRRLLLFCHDPTALPFLAEEPAVRARLPQIERTVIGHLHSRFILGQSRLLAGMPAIRFLGHTPERLSTALRRARLWKPFRVYLCPSPSGIELLKDGGYCTADLDLEGDAPAQWALHRLRR